MRVPRKTRTVPAASRRYEISVFTRSVFAGVFMSLSLGIAQSFATYRLRRSIRPAPERALPESSIVNQSAAVAGIVRSAVPVLLVALLVGAL